ncbi:MAG: DUF5683 domain-containing protein [Chitinispirillales bacterium]|jgi:hypothetical protein|nr:DUF5683 domain-containing protein [Chitinispirillales bacterium]
MNRHLFFAVFLLSVFAFNLASAQNRAGGAGQGVVLESVDDDIVEDEDAADTAAATFEDGVPSPKSSGEVLDDEDGELDIDKLLAGEDEEDLLADDNPVVQETVSAVDSVSVDSLANISGSGEESEQQHRGRRGGPPIPSVAADNTTGKIDSAALGPVVIEDGQSINFAHNLKEYRSPRLAMLLSLLVPGLGQAYSKSYVKAGAFGAAELAAIGTAVYFNSAGKSKKREAHKFADQRFSVDSLKRYDKSMRDGFTNANLPLPYDTTLYDDDFYDAADKKQTYYYERIREKYMTPGWIDFTPGIDEVESWINENSKFGDEWFGYSNFQAKYNSMMKDSKSRYDAVNYTLYAILINHIISAIDAGFTAMAYNSHLLGKDKSVWNRLSVEQQYVFTGSETAPGIALKVKF